MANSRPVKQKVGPVAG